MSVIAIRTTPLDLLGVLAAVRRDEDGAVVLFTGTVRAHNQGRAVTGLDYSAYEEMALNELRRVREQALARFAVSEVAVEHRLGTLAVGDVAVVVAVAAPHRDAAFEACRFVIDTLKRTVPIWKKERFTDGAVWLEGGG